MQSAQGPLGSAQGGKALLGRRELASRVSLIHRRERAGAGESERAGSWLVVVARSVVVGDRPRPSRGGGGETRGTGPPTGPSEFRPEPLEKGCRHVHGTTSGGARRRRSLGWSSRSGSVSVRAKLTHSLTHSLERHSQFSVRRLLVILRVHTYPVIFSRGERRYFECEDSICMCYHRTRREHPKPLTFECIERC